MTFFGPKTPDFGLGLNRFDLKAQVGGFWLLFTVFGGKWLLFTVFGGKWLLFTVSFLAGFN